MRLLLAALLVALPGLAEAQRHRPVEPVPPASTLPPIGLPLAPIGLPLPQIGLPLPPIGLAPPGTPSTSEASPSPRSRSPRQPHRRGRSGPSVVYVVPAYPWGPPPSSASGTPAPEPAEASAVPPRPTGTVWLDVEPRGVGEIYVDDYFVGTAADRRGTLTLDPGPHRVEIRAPGYETIRVDVKADAGGEVTLRRTLQPVAAAPTATPPAPEAPIRRKPFYFIPGCYLGDVPPTEARLPASCDQTKAVVVRP
jgi:hypothetical protein